MNSYSAITRSNNNSNKKLYSDIAKRSNDNVINNSSTKSLDQPHAAMHTNSVSVDFDNFNFKAQNIEGFWIRTNKFSINCKYSFISINGHIYLCNNNGQYVHIDTDTNTDNVQSITLLTIINTNFASIRINSHLYESVNGIYRCIDSEPKTNQLYIDYARMRNNVKDTCGGLRFSAQNIIGYRISNGKLYIDCHSKYLKINNHTYYRNEYNRYVNLVCENHTPTVIETTFTFISIGSETYQSSRGIYYRVAQ